MSVSFDSARLRLATLRTNGCDAYSHEFFALPFILSVAERQRSEV